MRIEIATPQIKALRDEVEKRVGKINGHDKFIKLEALIEKKCREHVSITTLQRLWGYSTRNASNVSIRTLDVISRVADANSWDDFCKKLHEGENKESELFSSAEAINCCNLAVGTRKRLAWQPDRICEVEYMGDYRFVATHTENSSIKPGDSFRCLQIERGRELYMDCFTRQGEEMENSSARYVVGQANGITIIEIIPPSDKNS